MSKDVPPASPVRGAQATVPPGTSQTALVATPSRLPVSPPARPLGSRSTSSWRRWALWLTLAGAGAAGGWLFYAQPWTATPTPVAVELVTPGPITRVLAVNGRIAALHSVAVKSTVAGILVAPLAAEGDAVAEGALLARVDDTSQQAAVRQAEATLVQATLAQSQARDALSRAEALGANVSRVTLEEARSALARADQEVDRLQALLEQAEFQLTKFRILAPISGTILKRGAEPGQVIDLSTQLFTLADLSELVVETDVDESYATQIRLGMPALLQLTGDARTLDGSVSFVAPVVDADTGGLAVKIAFQELKEAPVGLTVTANIIVDQRDDAISVPRPAIIATASGSAVFVAVGGQARLSPITTVDWPADRLIVTEGLRAGDKLIIDATGLADGQSVTVAGS
jgi:RND family efflux transporter MFP subunit